MFRVKKQRISAQADEALRAERDYAGVSGKKVPQFRTARCRDSTSMLSSPRPAQAGALSRTTIATQTPLQPCARFACCAEP